MLRNIFGANFVVYILRVVPFVLSIVQSANHEAQRYNYTQ